jgi:hypothetical protein
MPEFCPLLLSPARPGVAVVRVSLVSVVCEPSAAVVVTTTKVVMTVADDELSPAALLEVVGWAEVEEDVWSVGASLVGDGLELVLSREVGVGVGCVGVGDLVGEVSEDVVGSAVDDDGVSVGEGEVLVEEVASLVFGRSSSSCLRWIPSPSRPTILTLTKVASAADIAESPRAKIPSALVSCIVTDVAARQRRKTRDESLGQGE